MLAKQTAHEPLSKHMLPRARHDWITSSWLAEDKTSNSGATSPAVVQRSRASSENNRRSSLTATSDICDQWAVRKLCFFHGVGWYWRKKSFTY